MVGLATAELISGGETPGEGVTPRIIGSGFSDLGVLGRLLDFAGPDRASSALRLAKSTVSRKVIAASKFVKQ
jgi:hypothetical protein